MTRQWLIATVAVAATLSGSLAQARQIQVGPSRTVQTPGEAAQLASDGDVVSIDPATYEGCAIWKASNLKVEATGPGVIVTGKSCAGKGLFLVTGANVTITGITFSHATVPDHNGAGIRAEGRSLTVEHSRFLQNEDGILATGGPDAILRVVDSEFIGNGACYEYCAHGIYAGAPIRVLDVERSVFRDTKAGHHIKSQAQTTIVRDSRIEDGPTGTASYLIELPRGGNADIENNVLEKGPNCGNHSAAIVIGAEGVSNPTTSLVIRNDTFINDMPRETAFVHNLTTTPVTFHGNKIPGDARAVDGPVSMIQ